MLKSPRILIVDDYPTIRLAIATAFRRICSFDIHEAGNSDEAIELMVEQFYDLILCDLNMPGSDGLVLMKYMAKHNIDSHLVIMSGEEEELLYAAKSLATSYNIPLIGATSKPIPASKLKHFIELSQTSNQTNKTLDTEEISEKDLALYLSKNYITAYFQPQVNLQSQTLAGFEALARIEHPEKGLIPPSMFIDVAERSGLMSDLTFKVANKALTSFKKWLLHYPDITLSINLSAKMLESQDFPDVLANLVNVHTIPAENIICELTETIVAQDPIAMLNNMIRLRMKKFKLSIDDFGTGYASMSQLKQMPFHELKIDQCFIADYLDNTKSG